MRLPPMSLSKWTKDARKNSRKSFSSGNNRQTVWVTTYDSDDAVDIIREMNETNERILSHIEDAEQAGDIVDLLKYDEDTAGGLMGTEMVIVNENWSMPRMSEMRIGRKIWTKSYVYVVDDDQRLRGVFVEDLITDPSYRSEARDEERTDIRPCE